MHLLPPPRHVAEHQRQEGAVQGRQAAACPDASAAAFLLTFQNPTKPNPPPSLSQHTEANALPSCPAPPRSALPATISLHAAEASEQPGCLQLPSLIPLPSHPLSLHAEASDQPGCLQLLVQRRCSRQ